MIKMKRTIALVVAVAGMVLAGSAAQAASSISIIWQGTGTDAVTASSSSLVKALIVLQGDSAGVSALGISFLYDVTELTVVNVTEYSSVNLPGMGNSFAPLNAGNTVIDGGAGVITGFDQATLATGCINCTVTLGSIQFHVLNNVGLAGTETDVIATLTGSDLVNDVFNNPATVNFSGAEVVGPAVVPEPTTALLVIGGLLGLGYSGRRNLR